MSANNAIASGSVVLSASADGLLSGLDRAEKAVGKWAHDVDRTVANVGGGKAGKGGGAGGGLLGGALVGGAIGGAVGFAAGAALGAISDIGAGVSDLMGRIDATVEAAERLGVSAAGFSALTHAAQMAGATTEDLSAGVKTLEKNLSAASAGDAGLSQAFARIGVSAAQLKTLDVEDQMSALADGLAKVQNPADRAALAMKLLGDSGVKLLPALNGGAAGLKSATDEARKLGLVLSDTDAAGVDAAGEAFARLKATVEGIGTRVIVALAPAAEAVALVAAETFELVKTAVEAAGAMLGLGGSGTTAGGLMLDAFELAAKGAGYVWDALKAGAGAMAYVAGFVVDGFAQIVLAFQDTIKDLLDLAGKLPDMLGGQMYRDAAADVDKWGARIEATGERMRTWGKGTFDDFGASAEKAGKWFDRIRAKAGQAAEAKDRLAVPGGPIGDAGAKLAGALDKGSAAAYSAVAKFQVGAMTGQWGAAGDAAKQQVQELKHLNGFVKLIADAVKNVTVERV